MSDPFEALRAKKAKILADAEREAAAVDADLRDLERLKVLAEKYGFTLAPATIEQAVRMQAPLRILPKPGNEEREEPAYARAIKAAEELVRAASHPLELSDIYDGLVKRGVPLAGERPRSTLSAYLSHEKSTLQSIRKGWYWLKDEPVPEFPVGSLWRET
ncbi:hypothetical protein [Bradyrhizobium mercantei]|uniref:hypothetical protein n=1 Tax=Bradyrhizobium mercantei TaxID=1904807 RepID=UPI0009788B27|nr:hypothetical protein [Bradyrhizobium mercantei]